MRRNECDRSHCSVSATIGKLALAMLVVLAVTSLAASKNDKDVEVEYDPTLSHKFQPRLVPARITRDNAATIESGGYFKLGNINVFYPDNSRNAAGKLEEMLLKEAAGRGGDVVLIETENVPNEKAQYKTKKGKCLESGPSTSREVSHDVYITDYYNNIGNTHFSHTETNTITTPGPCLRWGTEEQVPTKPLRGLTTTGTLWRHVEREDKEDLGAVLPGLVGAGQIQLAKQLLQWGVPVNVADDEGFTALHRAIQGNHPDLVQILLENGADVNASVKSGPYAGKTSLMMASASREGSVEPLLTRGAKVDQTDKYGATALAYAINSWNVEAIKQLASHGANLNWQNERGETYLMLAAQRAHGDTMKALLDLGANKSLKSKDGKTAGDLAKTAMTEWEKGDFFTKNPRLRSESMAVIGYASEDRDWHDAIISSAQEWLTYSPGDPEAYTWLARGYFYDPTGSGKSDFGKAAESYQAVIRNAGKSQVGPYLLHEARVMLPVCYDHAGQWQNEVNAYEDAVREFATDAEVLNAAAWFYAITKSGLHNPGKALEYANRAIAAAPNDPNIVDTLATAYFANGRIADAIATEKKALALAPNRKDLQKDMEEFKQAQRAKQSRNTKQPGTK